MTGDRRSQSSRLGTERMSTNRSSNSAFDRTVSGTSRAVREKEHGPRRSRAGDQQGRWAAVSDALTYHIWSRHYAACGESRSTGESVSSSPQRHLKSGSVTRNGWTWPRYLVHLGSGRFGGFGMRPSPAGGTGVPFFPVKPEVPCHLSRIGVTTAVSGRSGDPS